MSAPAFTPGPWTPAPWITSLGQNVYRIIKAANRNVSSVTVYGKRSDGSTGGQKIKGGGHAKTVASAECDANAYLIAASPNLYALLDRLNRRGGLGLDVHEEIEAALAKARGEA
jgi:hypothetical protein